MKKDKPPCLVNGAHLVEHAAAECPRLGRTRQERIGNWRASQQAAAEPSPTPTPLRPQRAQPSSAPQEGAADETRPSPRAAGLPSDLVRALRDEGIRLGMQVDGKPLSDEVVDGALKKYTGRLTATQAKALKAYWRRIEGGGAA